MLGSASVGKGSGVAKGL